MHAAPSPFALHHSPKRILVIGLSNIGDAVLMSPVIHALHAAAPAATLTLVVGERARSLFERDSRVQRLVVMEEFSGWRGRLRLVGWLWQQRPDVLIDLRQTLLPLVWRPWRAWRYLRPVPRRLRHMRERHLWRLHTQLPAHPVRNVGFRTSDFELENPQSTIRNPQSIWISPEDITWIEHLMKRWGLETAKRLVVICPGARSHIKRWEGSRFAQLADRLITEEDVEVVFSGEPDEGALINEVREQMRQRAHTAVGSTTLTQVAALMQRSALVMTNDSASLHLACAVGAPVVALFGPTDETKYGPTGARDRVLRRRLVCAPCEQALCRFHHECMRFVGVDEVYAAACQLLHGEGSRVKGEG